MSGEVLNVTEDGSDTNAGDYEDFTIPTPWFNEEGNTTTFEPWPEENVNNSSIADKQLSQNESQVFEAFIIIEIVMTALELILSILAATKVARWRRNYRNQMLMQLSLVRFLKRLYSLVEFYKDNRTIPDSDEVKNALISADIYIDFVIVFLVSFFIKHMYDSLIVVLVKINQNQLKKVIMYSWFLPVPLTCVTTTLVLTNLVWYDHLYIFICAVCRWPLMLIGTVVYLVIVFRIVTDKIRQFARSLAIITFLLCLIINLHLLSRDIIFLFRIVEFVPVLASFTLGFVMNLLILCLYIVLITLHLRSKSQPCGDNLNYSEYVTKC